MDGRGQDPPDAGRRGGAGEIDPGLRDPESVSVADGDQAWAKGGPGPGAVGWGADPILGQRKQKEESEATSTSTTPALGQCFMCIMSYRPPSSTGRQNSHFTGVKTDTQRGVPAG